jgi:hypothetical protein
MAMALPPFRGALARAGGLGNTLAIGTVGTQVNARSKRRVAAPAAGPPGTPGGGSKLQFPGPLVAGGRRHASGLAWPECRRRVRGVRRAAYERPRRQATSWGRARAPTKDVTVRLFGAGALPGPGAPRCRQRRSSGLRGPGRLDRATAPAHAVSKRSIAPSPATTSPRRARPPAPTSSSRHSAHAAAPKPFAQQAWPPSRRGRSGWHCLPGVYGTPA